VLYPKGALTSAWRGTAKAYSKSPQQEASKMRSVNADSAASPDAGKWDQTDWPIMHRRVRRWQTRIAKATRDQNWRRVKAFATVTGQLGCGQLAVKRVLENDGKQSTTTNRKGWCCFQHQILGSSTRQSQSDAHSIRLGTLPSRRALARGCQSGCQSAASRITPAAATRLHFVCQRHLPCRQRKTFRERLPGAGSSYEGLIHA
jgi:hypothetical protein